MNHITKVKIPTYILIPCQHLLPLYNLYILAVLYTVSRQVYDDGKYTIQIYLGECIMTELQSDPYFVDSLHKGHGSITRNCNKCLNLRKLVCFNYRACSLFNNHQQLITLVNYILVKVSFNKDTTV